MLGHGEIITGITLPAPKPLPSVYRKLARVAGDFATASCALALDVTAAGPTINVAIGGCGPAPPRERRAGGDLRGRAGDPPPPAALGAPVAPRAPPVGHVPGCAPPR